MSLESVTTAERPITVTSEGKPIMASAPYRTALIIGAGVGISAWLARLLAREGLKVGLVGLDAKKLERKDP